MEHCTVIKAQRLRWIVRVQRMSEERMPKKPQMQKCKATERMGNTGKEPNSLESYVSYDRR